MTSHRLAHTISLHVDSAQGPRNYALGGDQDNRFSVKRQIPGKGGAGLNLSTRVLNDIYIYNGPIPCPAAQRGQCISISKQKILHRGTTVEAANCELFYQRTEPVAKSTWSCKLGLRTCCSLDENGMASTSYIASKMGLTNAGGLWWYFRVRFVSFTQ